MIEQFKSLEEINLRSVVNFAKNLQAAFAQILFWKKSQSQAVIREKLQKALSYKKGKRKMLMKLTPVVNFNNILWAPFVPILFQQKITKPSWNLREATQNTFVWISCL